MSNPNADYTASVSSFTSLSWCEETQRMVYIHDTPILWCIWGMGSDCMTVYSPITGEDYLLQGEAMERMLLTLR